MFKSFDFLLLVSLALLLLAWNIPQISLLSLGGLVPIIYWLAKYAQTERSYFHVSILLFAYSLALTVPNTRWLFSANTWLRPILANIVLSLVATFFWLLIYWFLRKKISHKFINYTAIIVLLVLHDFLHLRVNFGFPMLSYGNFFRHNPSLIQWYSLTGTLGGTLWIVTANLVVLSYFKKTKHSLLYRSLPMFLSFLVPICLSLYMYNTDSNQKNEVAVIAVHTNFDCYGRKFKISSDSMAIKQLAILQDINTSTTDLIVFPETSLNEGNWLKDITDWPVSKVIIEWMKKFSPSSMVVFSGIFHERYHRVESKTHLPVGVDASAAAGGAYYNYNTSLAYKLTGSPRYRVKQKLVPFEESFPFVDALGLRKNFPANFNGKLHSGKPRTIVFAGNRPEVRVGSLICYEALYGIKSTELAAKGATLITILTNEGWFKDPYMAQEMAALSRLRAIETRRAIIRSSNRGISAIYNQKGQIISVVSGAQEGVAIATVSANKNISFYTKYKDYIGWSAVLGAMILCLYLVLRKRENGHKGLPFFASFILLYLLTPNLMAGQNITGVVRNSATAESLVGANVYSLRSGQGVTTDETGAYTYPLPNSDENIFLIASFVGFASDTFKLEFPYLTKTYDFELSPAVSELKIEVRDRYKTTEGRTNISTNSLSRQEIESIPALLGEADALRALQVLPGIQAGVEGQTGLFVRGGGNDQNLVLLDGVPIYNPNHLFGFFSIFDANAIEDITVIKGGFPARYGGRLSSVVDIQMRTGLHKSSEKSFTLSPLLSKAFISGEIGREAKLSYYFGVRRTIYDLVVNPFRNKNNSSQGDRNQSNFYFWDTNFKLAYSLSSKDYLSCTGYFGKDFYRQSIERSVQTANNTNRSTELLTWRNLVGSLRYRRIWSDRLTQTVTAGKTAYDYTTGNTITDERGNGEVSSSLFGCNRNLSH